MRRCVAMIAAFMSAGALAAEPFRPGLGGLSDRYIEAWKRFYPSSAYQEGFLGSLGEIEDYSPESIAAWVELNRSALSSLESMIETLPLEDRLDARLLRIQTRSEIEKWEWDRPHETSISLYIDPIALSVRRVQSSALLSPRERLEIVQAQLGGVRRLCAAAARNLRNGRPALPGAHASPLPGHWGTDDDLEKLEAAARYYEKELPEESEAWSADGQGSGFLQACRSTAVAVRALAAGVLSRDVLLDTLILGKDDYARKLRIYTDSDLTPERLAQISLQEIQDAKHAISELAADFWRRAHPDRELPEVTETIRASLSAVESRRPQGEQEYLTTLREYARQIESFVREKRVVTMPAHHALSIELAPESAGPLARIGYVSSAPPFHPNPWTVWYLATIPDSHPERERVDFWRSFNYAFKRFIVIHELFPGHYLQNQILRENLHPVRILFPYGPYSEGWATHCERVVLDAGWAEGDPLTLLAQLRKRLENANRAYTSVQAHCNGWTESEVFTYSVESSLLAPQFAKSLWGRLMESPLQMITYMLGSLQFREVYEAERRRRGSSFRAVEFMDTALRTGPVPIEELSAVLREKYR